MPDFETVNRENTGTYDEGPQSGSTAAQGIAQGETLRPNAKAELVELIRRHWPEIDADAAAGEMLAVVANARQRAAQDAEPSIPRKPR